MPLSITLAQNEFHLLADRAAFHVDSASLLLSDVHFGKAASFRAQGVPVPAGTSEENLRRLCKLIELTQAKHLIVLGDLVHDCRSLTESVNQSLCELATRFPLLRKTLVLGNHDIKAGPLPPQWGFETVTEPFILGEHIRLVHGPGAGINHVANAVRNADKSLDVKADNNADAQFSICGHIHPVYRLSKGIDSVRLPCFWLGKSQLVLPSFGAFTGGHLVQPEKGDRLFLTDGEHLYPFAAP